MPIEVPASITSLKGLIALNLDLAQETIIDNLESPLTEVFNVVILSGEPEGSSNLNTGTAYGNKLPPGTSGTKEQPIYFFARVRRLDVDSLEKPDPFKAKTFRKFRRLVNLHPLAIAINNGQTERPAQGDIWEARYLNRFRKGLILNKKVGRSQQYESMKISGEADNWLPDVLSNNAEGNTNGDYNNINTSGPASNHSYPPENVKMVEDYMTEKGITNCYLRNAILAVIAKESNFKPKSERGYQNTSVERFRKIFGRNKVRTGTYANILVKNMTDAQIVDLKSDAKKMFDALYDLRIGNKAGEGYKYRGRGYNQITGRDNYASIGKLIGRNLLASPDLLNTPEIAGMAAVAFAMRGIKARTGTINPNVTNQHDAIVLAAESNCKSVGSNKNCSYAIEMTTGRINDFRKCN